MLDRRFIEQYARGCGVNLDVAEREVTLSYVLAALHEHGLASELAFKGGTYFRKMVFGTLGRFSEDLDFVYLGDDWEEWYLRLEQAWAIPYHGVRLKVDEYYDTATSLGLEVSYTHAFVTEGHFTLDLSRRAPMILPLEVCDPVSQSYFPRLPFTAPSLPCMHLAEAWAEKVRASYERTKARDLYDLSLLAKRPVDMRLLRRLVILKMWEDRRAFRADDLWVRWSDAEDDWSGLERLCRPPLTPFSETLAACYTRYLALHDLDSAERDLAIDVAHRQRARAMDMAAEARTCIN